MRFLFNNFVSSKLFINYIKTHEILLIRQYCVVSEQNERRHNKVNYAEIHGGNEQKSLNVAVIGVPNVGKSTFINNIVNHRVCPTSSKVHTTRKANKAIYTKGESQLVFYDTPGLVTQREIRKHHLDQSFKSAYRHAVQHADLIAVLHDVSNSWTRNQLHPTVLDTLKAYPTMPSVLILNKVDVLKSKRILLELIKTLTNDTLSVKRLEKRKSERKLEPDINANEIDQSSLLARNVGWTNFSDVFLVSAITGSGLNDVQDYLIDVAKPRPWDFASDIYTDEKPEELIVESVRARLLDYLPQEIPYTLQCVLEYYSTEKNTIYTSVQVICPSARVERLICGESNGKLRQITERVTSDLVEMFGKAISLTISTRSTKKEK